MDSLPRPRLLWEAQAQLPVVGFGLVGLRQQRAGAKGGGGLGRVHFEPARPEGSQVNEPIGPQGAWRGAP